VHGRSSYFIRLNRSVESVELDIKSPDDRGMLERIIDDAFAARGADEVTEALDAAGIANARLRTSEELIRHLQLLARGRWQPVGIPGGDIDALLPPAQITGQQPMMGPVPALGQHIEAIRAESAPGRRNVPA
jgi:itaconate CoA-transferase